MVLSLLCLTRVREDGCGSAVKYPEPRPMSATVKARVDRVNNKKEMLDIAFKAQAPPRCAEGDRD